MVLLEGATTMPAENAECADAGEFAALWNSWNQQRREDALRAMHSSSARSLKCFIEDHETWIGDLRHQIAERDLRILNLERIIADRIYAES